MAGTSPAMTKKRIIFRWLETALSCLLGLEPDPGRWEPVFRKELSPQRALGVHVQRVDRLARCHEQPVALQSAETQIGAALRQRDAADLRAVGGEYEYAVQFRIAHAP